VKNNTEHIGILIEPLNFQSNIQTRFNRQSKHI